MGQFAPVDEENWSNGQIWLVSFYLTKTFITYKKTARVDHVCSSSFILPVRTIDYVNLGDRQRKKVKQNLPQDKSQYCSLVSV